MYIVELIEGLLTVTAKSLMSLIGQLRSSDSYKLVNEVVNDVILWAGVRFSVLPEFSFNVGKMTTG